MSYNGPIPNPLTVASFTLTTGGHNIIYAAGSAPFLPIRDVFSSSIHSPLNGTIGDHFHQGPFDLLGFRVGNLVGPDFTDVTLNFASGATYSTVVASMPIQVGLLFHGFLAPPGEFFSGFSLSPHGIDSRVATDYFVVGTSACTGPGCGSPTPEPSGWALMIVGFGASGAALRRRRAAPAFAG